MIGFREKWARVLDFWLLKSKTFESWPHISQGCACPYFQQLLQLWFCGIPPKNCIFHFTSVRGPERAIFVRWLPRAGCRGDTTTSFKGRWPWRIAIPEVTSIFSVCLHIVHFLNIRMFEFKFKLWYINYTSNLFVRWLRREGCKMTPL
jgi:hypothetical protein